MLYVDCIANAYKQLCKRFRSFRIRYEKQVVNYFFYFFCKIIHFAYLACGSCRQKTEYTLHIIDRFASMRRKWGRCLTAAGRRRCYLYEECLGGSALHLCASYLFPMLPVQKHCVKTAEKRIFLLRPFHFAEKPAIIS